MPACAAAEFSWAWKQRRAKKSISSKRCWKTSAPITFAPNRRARPETSQRIKSGCEPDFAAHFILLDSDARNSHRFLFISQCDTHLLEGDLIQSARHLETFGFLVILETSARRWVQLSGLVTTIKTALLQNRLRLFDLISVGPEDRLAIRITLFICLVAV